MQANGLGPLTPTTELPRVTAGEGQVIAKAMLTTEGGALRRLPEMQSAKDPYTAAPGALAQAAELRSKVFVHPEEEARAASVPIPTKLPTRENNDGFGPYPDSPHAQELRAREALRGRPVPSDFGVPGGTAIANIESILPDMWAALGSKKPPDILYLMVKGMTNFAHAACAYRAPDGSFVCMNIVGKPGQTLANFLSPQEYLFGVNELTAFDANYHEIQRSRADGGPWRNPEGAVYHRDIDGIAVWDWPDEKLAQLHEFYTTINTMQKEHEARFRLVPGPWRDVWDRMWGIDKRESGNCALWTTRGLVECGLIEHMSMWPKEGALRILHGEGRKNPDNVDIVSFKWIPHARRTHLADDRLIAMLPFVPKKLGFYKPESHIVISAIRPTLVAKERDLGRLAAARTVCDPGTTVARIECKSRAWSRL